MNEVNDYVIERKINQLNLGYAECIDADRIEEWPSWFLEDGRYLIQTRENLDKRLDGGYWMYFTNRSMIRDRVTALRHISTYNKHYYRHLVGNARIVGRDEAVYFVRASYLIVQISYEGRTECTHAGEYRDKIVFRDGTPYFKERLVVCDTFHTPSAVVYPL